MLVELLTFTSVVSAPTQVRPVSFIGYLKIIFLLKTMPTDRDKRDDTQNRESSYVRKLVGEATSLGFSVFICVLGGVGLDNWLKTAPVFILVGVFLALATI